MAIICETYDYVCICAKKKRSLEILFAMVAMSRTAKSAIFYSIIGIAIGIGLILLLVDIEILVGLFQIGVSEDNNNNNPSDDRPFRYRTFYKAILAVGEGGTYAAEAGGGKPPYTFEWEFSDGITMTGDNITRTFNSPGIQYFSLTVTDADDKQVKSAELNTRIVPEISKEEETAANNTSISSN
jgi:PKD domain